MLFRPPYNALFEVRDVILPGTSTRFGQWFTDNKMTIKRTIVFIMLTQYVAQGRFKEPAMYLIHVHRVGLRIRGTLFKFPLNSSQDMIVEFLNVVNIPIEGLNDVIIRIDPRLN